MTSLEASAASFPLIRHQRPRSPIPQPSSSGTQIYEETRLIPHSQPEGRELVEETETFIPSPPRENSPPSLLLPFHEIVDGILSIDFQHGYEHELPREVAQEKINFPLLRHTSLQTDVNLRSRSSTPLGPPPNRPFFSPENIGKTFPGSFPSETYRRTRESAPFPTPTPEPPEVTEWWNDNDPSMPSMEEFSRILDEKLRAQLEPIQNELRALKQENRELKDPALARKKHLNQLRAGHEKWLADSAGELKSIEEGTWEKPIVLDHMVSINLQGTGDFRGNGQSTRFRPELLLKFSYGSDLDSGIIRMDHLVKLWGETSVCPHIHANSFINGDTIETWYFTLEPIVQQAMTEHPGCWERFKKLMATKWSKPEGVKQNECDNRSKLPSETYAQYGIAKTQLCKMAFPGSTDAGIIQKIRSRLDIEANRFCREKNSLSRFYDELVDFDATSPMVTIHTHGGQKNQQPWRTSDGATREVTPQANQRPTQRRQKDPPPGRQDAAARKLSVKDRMNPTTNKMTRSFTNKYGEPRFIDRPCDRCTAKGKTAWHFRFECPEDPGLKSYLSNLFGDAPDPESEPPGMQIAPYTGNLTSHNFIGDGMAYANAVMRYDEGFDSSDSDSENGVRNQ